MMIRNNILRPEWLLAFITILFLAPFLSKAFHIDDPLFIWTAKQITQYPLDFFGFEKNWYGFVQPMHEINQNPPLVSYFQALIGFFFGWSEIAMHTAFLVPAIAVTIGVYRLGKEFCQKAVFASLFFILMPGFLVSATNIMSDIPMLACYVWSIVYWKKGLKENTWKFFALGAFLASVAALTKYFAITLVPLLFIYSCLEKKRLSLPLLWLLLPVLILILYQINSKMLYGHGLFGDAAAYALNFAPSMGAGKSFKQIFSSLINGLSFLGGSMLSVIFLFPFLYSSKARLFLGGVFPLIGCFLWFLQDQSWDLALQQSFFILVGAHLLIWSLLDLWEKRNSDSFLLASLILGTFIFSCQLNWSVNIRTLLPLIPAAIMVLFRRLENNVSRPIPFLPLLCVLIPSAGLTLTVAWADFSLANTQKEAAKKIMHEYKTPTTPVWFLGHWGFQYYMELLDARSIDFNRTQDTQGCIIIIPVNNTNSLPPEDFFKSSGLKLTLIKIWEKEMFSYAHTMRPQRNAGFYFHLFGKMPYSFGGETKEEFLVLMSDNKSKIKN